MLTLMLGTVFLALTYGSLWHKQPARPQNADRGDNAFPLGGKVNVALQWLLLMRRLPGPVESEPVRVSEKNGIPTGQTKFFRPLLRTLCAWNPWRRILVDRAAVGPSISANRFQSFQSKANTNELPAEPAT
jgi:hypothetical protein